jgi:hypothetical protein
MVFALESFADNETGQPVPRYDHRCHLDSNAPVRAAIPKEP